MYEIYEMYEMYLFVSENERLIINTCPPCQDILNSLHIVKLKKICLHCYKSQDYNMVGIPNHNMVLENNYKQILF